MRHIRLVQVLAVFILAAAGSAASAEEPQLVGAQLGTPFVLVKGQTCRVVPEGLEVTLRSVSDDSGCFAPDDCSVALFKGTIAMRLGEKRSMTTVFATLKYDETTDLDFAGYEIRFGTVRRLDDGTVQATFTVTKAPPEEEEDERD